MAAAVQIYPLSGSITAKLTACRVTCTGVDNNDSTAFDANKYPTEPQLLYRFRARRTGSDDLLSVPFSTNPSGKGEWPGTVMFPAAGSWTLTLRNANTDAEVATASISVS